jgi:hypothetical protein
MLERTIALEDKELIVLMSKIAHYDQKTAIKDKKITSYFLYDYVYIENFKNRFFAFLGICIIILLHWVIRIATNSINLLDINLQSFIISNGAIIFSVLFMYSVFGSVRATNEYNGAKKRIDRYLKALKKINQLKINEQDVKENFNE